MKIIMNASRLVLGVIFFVAGINGYFVIFGLEPFIATSPDAMALFEFKHLLVAVKTLEVIGGFLLIINQFIALAAAFLSPIAANIFMLHVFVDHSLLPLAILLVLAHGCLLYGLLDSYQALFRRKPDIRSSNIKR